MLRELWDFIRLRDLKGELEAIVEQKTNDSVGITLQTFVEQVEQDVIDDDEMQRCVAIVHQTDQELAQRLFSLRETFVNIRRYEFSDAHSR